MKELLKLVTKFKQIFSYYNMVEYACPAALLLILIVVDAYVLMGIDLLALIPNKFLTVAAAAGTFTATGWLMYVTRFYQLFPGYKKAKLEFRRKLVVLFPEHTHQDSGSGEQLGKFLFQRYWEVVQGETREQSLRFQVQWVSLVHISNAIALSFTLAVVLLVLEYFHAFSSVGSTLLSQMPAARWAWLSLHVPIYVYFRRAAIRNRSRSNFLVLTRANELKEEISARVPPNLSDFLDAID